MVSVAMVVRRFGAAYLERYGSALLPSHRRAVRDLAACRTAALGGHVSQCDTCGAEHYVYHSCRNRSCPTCHGEVTAAWLAAREGELLPVPYFHVVFTLPRELRDLVRSHQRVLLNALMTTAAEALQAMARDPHYVGGTLGILAVLHTWTRALLYHPHVHCLVPGGARAPNAPGHAVGPAPAWRPARANFLVPVRALSVRFRARFLAHLQRALPTISVPSAVWRKPWVVYCKPTVQGSALVLRYLARYVHRVAISDARIRTVTAKGVTFTYKDAARHQWRTMTLSGPEFLRRFLQHVLPRGFHKVRYYGLWRPAAAPVRATLRQELAGSAPGLVPKPELMTRARCDRCPQCGRGILHRIRSLPRLPLALHTGLPP